MKKPVLLSVEDDEDIQELLRYNLVKAGFAVLLAESGEEAIEKLGGTAPDLVILDLMLPGMNGLEVCKTMKRIDSLKEIPIIMLTAKGEEIDVITGLDLGADDYVSKPFSPKVLVARIKAVLRKKTEKSASEAKEESSLIVQGSLAIDPAKYEVKVEGIKVRLTVTEFNILKLLAKREGWVFTRQQIIDAVKGYEFSVTPRAVDVHIFSLRSKLGKAGEKIESIRGIGYRLR
ncbi:MAG TPA: DNA-binding response regulator [Desulfobulbaceae bacterium]|nr:DNA-binding response regulator [Desulfobulbaceae bacterium]